MQMDVNDKWYVRLIVWDASGAEEWQNTVTSCYSKTHVAIIMYDVTNRLSFDRFGNYLKELRK